MHKNTNGSIELSSLSYAEKRLVVVASDEEIEKQRRDLENSQKQKGIYQNLKKATQNNLLIPSLLVGGPVLAAGAGIQVYKKIIKSKYSNLDVLTISGQDANSLTFPPGHPVRNILYIAHPTAENIYFPMAQFHRLVFEHKFSEAITLLMALGATELEVHHVTGWSREVSSTLDVPTSKDEFNAKAKTSYNKTANSDILFKASFNGNAEPSLPEGLVWYPHEPTWKQIAEGRLKYGMEDFSLSVRYEDDLGVDSNLKLAATKAEVGLGGNFEDHKSTVWKITGRF